MNPFASEDAQDEGYSEHPLTSIPQDNLSSALASLQTTSDIAPWLAKYASILPLQVKQDLTTILLENLPTSSIAHIVKSLNHRLYIDFVRYLPPEICLKVLGYLDAVALVSVMRTCRAWHDLALDRKLWQRVYHMEGWKSMAAEIQKYEENFNSIHGEGAPGRQYRIQNMEVDGAHSTKRRALESSPEDAEMTDREQTTSDRMTSPLRRVAPATVTSASSDAEAEPASATVKGKEVERDTGRLTSPIKRKDPPEEDGASASAPPPSSTSKSQLMVWDDHVSQYRMNWKHLYDMRLKLEANWDLGRFTTFQLPHPDHPKEGHIDCIYTLQFDQNYIVSGSRDRTMRIWSMRTKRLLMPPLTGHTASVLCLQYDASPDEDLLVSGSSDSHVFIWQFSTGKLLQKIRAHSESVLNVRFDHRVLVTSSKDKTIKIFNRRALKYGDVGYGPSDKMVNPVALNLKRYGYDPSLGDDLPVKPAYTMIGRLHGHSAAVNAVQVLGDTVVSVSGDRQIKVWDWPGQVCTRTIPAHSKGIACVEYDGRRIVSGSSDYEVCVFDAATGLKVATLRGHIHLVRTIQAGFGDLPYSKAEDEAEAKAKDESYFRAVQAGEVDAEETWRAYRRRRRQGSSSAAANVQSIGAKLPPGGGGSRRYGRIVSGSYDHTVIIWRRDNKEGVWRPAHHLRPADAASAARREAMVQRGPLRREPGHPDSGPPSAPFGYHVSDGDEASGSMPSPATIEELFGRPPPGPREVSLGVHALIDQSMTQGPAGLSSSFIQRPELLQYTAQFLERIEREPSPFVRSQFRQVIEIAISAYQRRLRRAQGRRTVTASASAGPSSSTAGVAGSDRTTNPVATEEPTRSATEPPPAQSQTQAAPPPPPTSPPPPPARSADAPRIPSANAEATTTTAAEVPPPPTPAAAEDTQAAPPPVVDELHHPHIPEEAGGRIFKIQFDAGRLMCCSQSTMIVGWDFCSGDAELEEAAQFFATLD